MSENKSQPLKCGIEIHQRLSTPTKLFCSCANDASGEGGKPVAKVVRRLRAVAGELGAVDPAAAFEAGREGKFLYNAFEKSTCLVELDEEPPHEISREALEAVLQIAMALKSQAVGEIHVMRKTVIDGSATGGFQRTALVATGGEITTPFGSVPVQTVCVEEESAGIAEKNGSGGEYNLDRLGIPLVEIATAPAMKSGEEAEQAAAAIGLLLRGTQKVARGIGTIRQDLNVSVEGGARCEIKGAQELAVLDKIVENEAGRQRWLVRIRSELREGGKFEHGEKEVGSAFGETKCAFIKSGLEKGRVVFGARLSNLAGMLGRELMPGHRLGTELSDYARAYGRVNGIIHSDEDLSKYGISQVERQLVANELRCTAKDAWAICVDEEGKAKTAIAAVVRRAEGLWHEVPKETRRAEGEGSRFMRPLPGSARMYPETDVPPIVIGERELQYAKRHLPASPQERRENYIGMGLGKQMADEMVSSPLAPTFERLIAKTKAPAVLVATTLLQTLRSLSREGIGVGKITLEQFEELFEAVGRGEIVKAAVPEVIREFPSGKSAREIIYAKNLRKIAGSELEVLVEGFDGKNRGEAFESIMRKQRTRVEAKELIDALGKKFGRGNA
ncbi:Glu-tRNA(Gln) amidotransferase subunit GatE [Candidatus Micrarchaeota archaeon]|nr:Glu-tRNA(Gln) amidotransferase subunit GatE [Candidatus Micrarchaeota archaeon]